MKTRLWIGQLAVAVLSIVGLFCPVSGGAELGTEGTNVVPLIYLDRVPVSDAIQNLARQADFNFILDVNIPRGCGGVEGRWTNVTCRYVLDQVLKQNDYELIENPATMIARIAPKNFKVQPVLLSAVGETNGARAVRTPLIVLEDVPLEVAITQLAANAKLKVSIDPRISNRVTEEGKPLRLPPVSIRWKDVTPRQALAALLDAYDLEVRDDAPGTEHWITIKDCPTGPDTTVMDLYTEIVTKLQDSHQTNLLELFNRYATAEIAQRTYADLGLQLRYLTYLREGRANEVIRLLEILMDGSAFEVATFYPQLSRSQQKHFDLEVLRKARDYREKYNIHSRDPEIEAMETNAFRLLDEQKGKTNSR